MPYTYSFRCEEFIKRVRITPWAGIKQLNDELIKFKDSYTLGERTRITIAISERLRELIRAGLK